MFEQYHIIQEMQHGKDQVLPIRSDLRSKSEIFKRMRILFVPNYPYCSDTGYAFSADDVLGQSQVFWTSTDMKNKLKSSSVQLK